MNNSIYAYIYITNIKIMPTNYIIETMPYEHTLLQPTFYYEHRSMCFQQHQFFVIAISFMSMVAFISYIIIRNIKLERDNYDLKYDNKINKNDVDNLKETILENQQTIVELEEEIDELKEYEKNNAVLTETLENYLSRKRTRTEYEKPTHSYNLRSKLKIAPPPPAPYNLRPRKNPPVSYLEEDSSDEEYYENDKTEVEENIKESEESTEEYEEESSSESEVDDSDEGDSDEGDFDDLDDSSSETSTD